MSEMPEAPSLETYFVATPLALRDDGAVVCDDSDTVFCTSPEAAVRAARRLATRPGYVGAWAFSSAYDPAGGRYNITEVFERCGALHWCPERSAWVA